MKANPYAPLFEPIRIGPKTAPNRFYAVPHGLGHSHLMPNGAIGIREMRAEGGWGTIAVELAEIDPTSDISDHPMEIFWDQADVKRHARLTKRVHGHGALAAIELGHTGLRSRGVGTGYPVWGPTSQPILMNEMPVQSKAMDKADIAVFRKSHRAAIRRAIEAEYDIAYVYAAHDASVLWHFLSPVYNQRGDEYGGSFENRLRLFREVLEEAREEAGDDIAIACRFAVHEASGDGMILNSGEGRDVVEALSDLPDLWDVNISSWPRDSGTSRFDEEGFQEEFVSFVKQVTTKPVVGVGRFTSPDAMLSMLRRGVLDLIGAARPSIADPFLPNKIREGRVEDIRECIGCNICVSTYSLGTVLRCTQNPTVSEEWRRGWHPEHVPTARDKAHSLIIGSGPAGLEAALVLARAGHQVTLAEAGEEFGGRVARESRLDGLGAWSRVRDYRLYQLRQMGNVQLYSESGLDADSVAEIGAEHVLLAAGARWLDDGRGRMSRLPLPGFAGAALTPDDIMAGAIPEGPVVIYDDDHYYMANILALHLAARGCAVELITPQPMLAPWMGYTLEQPRVMQALGAAGVATRVNSVATGWADGTLSLIRGDTGADEPPARAAHLVFAGARMPDNNLSEALAAQGIAHRLIGDAEAPGTIQAAVYSGHRHAREILGSEPEDRIFRRETPTLYL